MSCACDHDDNATCDRRGRWPCVCRGACACGCSGTHPCECIVCETVPPPAWEPKSERAREQLERLRDEAERLDGLRGLAAREAML